MTTSMISGSGRARFAAIVLGLVPVLAASTVADAQGNASSAAAGMGGNYTAVARNFNAAAWNPANLGLPGNSRFSIALSPQVGMGTGPVTLADFKEYEGRIVPAAIRRSWLQKIADNGGQHLGGEIDLTPIALSFGPVALSTTTSLRANGSIPRAMAELLFFGNAGRTGSPADYEFSDLEFDANATTTVAAAYGRKLASVPLLGDFAVGVTGKYIVGHGMASMRDNGSTVTSVPVQVNLDAPMVLTDTGSYSNGSGLGLDVGAAWSVGNFRAGAVVQNLINTFAWKTDNLYYVPVRATFDGNVSNAVVDGILPISTAPADLRERLTARVNDAKVKPTLALGGAYTGFRSLTLTADIRQRFGDGLELGPRTQIGAGAELRVIPFVPIRAGITGLTGGMRYSAGLGLEFGVVNFQASASLLNTDGRNDTAGGFTVSFGGR